MTLSELHNIRNLQKHDFVRKGNQTLRTSKTKEGYVARDPHVYMKKYMNHARLPDLMEMSKYTGKGKNSASTDRGVMKE